MDIEQKIKWRIFKDSKTLKKHKHIYTLEEFGLTPNIKESLKTYRANRFNHKDL